MSEQIKQMNPNQQGANGGLPEQPVSKTKAFFKRYGAFFLLLAAGAVTGPSCLTWQEVPAIRASVFSRNAMHL